MIGVSLHSESFTALARHYPADGFSSISIDADGGGVVMFIRGEGHIDRATAIADAINANGSVPVAAPAEAT